MLILDFGTNKIGFANKIKNHGAEITGEGAPRDSRIPDHNDEQDQHTDPVIDDPTDVPEDPTDVPEQPSDTPDLPLNPIQNNTDSTEIQSIINP